MTMVEQERYYEYEVRSEEGSCHSWKTLHADCLSSIVDRALAAYLESWKRAPDIMAIKRGDCFKTYITKD